MNKIEYRSAPWIKIVIHTILVLPSLFFIGFMALKEYASMDFAVLVVFGICALMLIMMFLYSFIVTIITICPLTKNIQIQQNLWGKKISRIVIPLSNIIELIKVREYMDDGSTDEIKISYRQGEEIKEASISDLMIDDIDTIAHKIAELANVKFENKTIKTIDIKNLK